MVLKGAGLEGLRHHPNGFPAVTTCGLMIAWTGGRELWGLPGNKGALENHEVLGIQQLIHLQSWPGPRPQTKQ